MPTNKPGYWSKWYSEHKTDRYKYQKKYYLLHAEETKTWQKEYRKKTRKDVIQHYGGKCSCCGISQEEFLTIDHIDGNGNKHRKENLGVFNASGFRFYRWLIKNNYPKGFQVLCFNCNSSKGFWGYCPHNLASK